MFYILETFRYRNAVINNRPINQIYMPSRVVVLPLSALAMIDGLLLKATKLSIVNFGPLAGSVACLIAITFWSIFRLLDKRITSAAIAALTFIIIAILGVFLSYSVAALSPMPLYDQEIILIDHMLNFDWRQFVSALDRYETICLVLGFSYSTIGFQIIVLGIASAASGDHATTDALMLTVGISLFIVNAIAFFVPTVGVTTLEPAQLQHLDVAGGILGQHDYLALRDGKLRVIDFESIVGLVTFPSFHAAASIFSLLCSRRVRFAFLPFLVIDAFMLISTFTHGGHYLCDVLVGSIVAVISWMIANRLLVWQRLRLEKIQAGTVWVAGQQSAQES